MIVFSAFSIEKKHTSFGYHIKWRNNKFKNTKKPLTIISSMAFKKFVNLFKLDANVLKLIPNPETPQIQIESNYLQNPLHHYWVYHQLKYRP